MAFVKFSDRPFVALGGELHTTYLDALDFERAEVNLLQLAGYLDNIEVPLLLARRIASEDMKDRFENETDPDRNKWADLSDIYSAQKQKDVGFEHPILTRSGDLKDAATDQNAWTVGADSIFFSTAGLPNYWVSHQFGRSETFQMGGSEKLGIEAGEVTLDNMPPRPFIGISAEAEEKILDTFDLWFGKGVEEAAKSFAVSSHGVLQTRTAGGRFGPKPIIG